MPTVEYPIEIPYPHDPNGRRYPRLTLRLANPSNTAFAIESDAYLDSGAERSLFDGRLAPVLGLDLLAGTEITFQSTTSGSVAARLHPMRVSHALLGEFDLEVGFSTAQVSRNLLGRDFFALVQIGFRESRLMLYMTAHP